MKYTMKIFNNNLNNHSKIINLKRKKGNLGKIKYYPSFSKEWKNIIYCYNQNNLKNIPVNNVNINKIIKSYFNLYFKNYRFVSRYKKFILLKRRKNFLNKIFVSNAEIKHTNNKALITLYTVNREILLLRKRYLKFNKEISKNLIRRLLRLYKKILAAAYFFSKNQQHEVCFALWNSIAYFDPEPKVMDATQKNKYLDQCEKSNQDNNQLIHKKNFFNYKLKHFNKYIKYQNIYLKKTLNFIINKYLKIYFKFLRKYDLMYSLNKYKFNKQILLPILSNILNKIIKKKIEYNIINLKSITYNTDIFTNALALKLKRKKDIKALKNMFKVLNRAYLPSSRLKSIKYFKAQAHNTSDQISLNSFDKINALDGGIAMLNSTANYSSDARFSSLRLACAGERACLSYPGGIGLAPQKKINLIQSLRNQQLRISALSALYTKSIQHYDIKNIHKYDDLNLISILNNNTAALRVNTYINSLRAHKQEGMKSLRLEQSLQITNLLNSLSVSKAASQSYKNLDKLLGGITSDPCLRRDTAEIGPASSKQEVHNIIYNSIGYKKMRGIRIEIKGRLTKRYRADRSIYSLKWKGGLKNVDSSFKGLSSILFRGNSNSNVSYSVYNSKRRIGAFAVKGWISGY
nr:ribosomal protein S3 [Ophiocordyceps sp.]